METLKMIQSRHAVREFSGQITDEQLQTILTAGNAGAVGMSQFDNYRIVAVQKPAVLTQLNGIHGAPTVIIVAASAATNMESVSAGIIVHNMELAAEDLGLGANYNMASLGSIPADVLPAGFKPLVVLTLGQTTDTFTPRDLPDDRIKKLIVK